MRDFLIFELDSVSDFKKKIILWSETCNTFCCLENGQSVSYRTNPATHSSLEYIAGIEAIHTLKLDTTQQAIQQLDQFTAQHPDWLLGGLSYDLKNDCEVLTSNNPDQVNFPALYFFCPRFVFLIQESTLRIEYLSAYNSSHEVSALYHSIVDQTLRQHTPISIHWQSRYTQQEYLHTIDKIQQHIHLGDVYEVNLCQEFFAQKIKIHPETAYLQLREQSPSPFMAYFKAENHYLLSASPERYLKKTGSTLLSQPIKGTARRLPNEQADNLLKHQLQTDPKERAENIMIVDLVRNDLARLALRGTVAVTELCQLYSFKLVHQLISTVVAKLSPVCSLGDILRATFPMGSMTGAPKIRAMQLIEQYEKTKRGMFSGAVGYIAPNGNFDFNVIIRTLLYNAESQYLSVQVGSAITAPSNPQKEYDECLLKAEGLRRIFD